MRMIHPKESDEFILLETLLASAPMGFSFFDRDLRYTKINSFLAKLHGFSAEEHIGRRISDDFADLGKIVEPKLREVLETGKTIKNLEITGIKDHWGDTPRHWLANYYPVIQSGTIIGVGAAVVEVTELRQAEQTARESSTLFSAVLDGSADAIFVKDRNGKYLLMNQAGASILRKTTQEVIGLYDFDLFSKEAARIIRKKDDAVMMEGETRTFEDEGVFEGQRIVLQSTKSPYRNANGEVIGVLGITRDITQAKKEAQDREILLIQEKIARERLENANESLRVERDLRESFVSALTHDLRNPLTAARAGAETLQRVLDQPEVLKSLSFRIVESLNRMDRMIRDLLDSSQVRAGERLPLKLSQFEMKDLLAHVIGELSATHGNRFKLALPSEPCEGTWGNEALTRILENLCTNAIRHGDPRTEINVKLECNEQEVTISVHNHGKPIPPEYQKTLFNPFRRAPSAKEGATQGWGLGLTVVRGLVEAHDGRCLLKSDAVTGTTFSIIIPRRNLQRVSA